MVSSVDALEKMLKELSAEQEIAVDLEVIRFSFNVPEFLHFDWVFFFKPASQLSDLFGNHLFDANFNSLQGLCCGCTGPTWLPRMPKRSLHQSSYSQNFAWIRPGSNVAATRLRFVHGKPLRHRSSLPGPTVSSVLISVPPVQIRRHDSWQDIPTGWLENQVNDSAHMTVSAEDFFNL